MRETCREPDYFVETVFDDRAIEESTHHVLGTELICTPSGVATFE